MKKNIFYKSICRTAQISLCLAFFSAFFSCKTITENTAEEDKIHSAVTEDTESSEKNEIPDGKPEKIQPEKIDTSEESENSVKEFIVQDEPTVKVPLYEKEKTEEKKDGKADGNSKNKDSVKENKEPPKSPEKEEKPKDSPRTKSAEEDKKPVKDEQDKKEDKDKDIEPETEEKSGGKEAEKSIEEDSLKEPAVKNEPETEAAEPEPEKEVQPDTETEKEKPIAEEKKKKEENGKKNKAEDESFILRGDEDISDEDIFGNFENGDDFDIESLIDESAGKDYARRGGDKEMKTETAPSKDFFYETPPPAEEPEEEPKSKISRSVSVGKGQRLELSYPAEGWVYLGEATAQKGLKYLQRKLQKENSVFTFNAEKNGNYILNFSFFDVFSGGHILDSVAVTVTSDKKNPEAKITAPPYEPENKKNKEESKAEKKNTDMQKTDIPPAQKEPAQKTETKPKAAADISPSAEPINKNASTGRIGNSIVFDEPDVFAAAAEANGRIAKQTETETVKDGKALIEQAEKEIAAGNAEKALKTLEEFFAASSARLDEGWFLKGKAYEINGKQKNMKAALEAYKFLVTAFPESSLWEKADARIRYIEKFYINIR